MHHFLIWSTWMEVSFFPAWLERVFSPFTCCKCLCWSRYDGCPISRTRIYCQKGSRCTGSEDENGTVTSSVSLSPDIFLKYKTDARVQDVTEGISHAIIIFHPNPDGWAFALVVVSVLRMIKLFGWERKMSERIRERRNDELGWLWKLKVAQSQFLSIFLSLMSYARC